MKSHVRAVMIFLPILTLAPACHPTEPPRIDAFYFEPLKVCRGDQVTLNWTAHGDSVTLIRNGTPQSVAQNGPLTETVNVTTLYRLEAGSSGFSPVSSESPVTVLTGNTDYPVELTVDCSSGRPAWSTRGFYPQEFSDSVQVNSVTNLSTYQVTINHRGATATANRGQMVSFAHVPLSGGWDGAATLHTNEGCPIPDRTSPGPQPQMPQPIRLSVNAGCP